MMQDWKLRPFCLCFSAQEFKPDEFHGACCWERKVCPRNKNVLAINGTSRKKNSCCAQDVPNLCPHKMSPQNDPTKCPGKMSLNTCQRVKVNQITNWLLSWRKIVIKFSVHMSWNLITNWKISLLMFKQSWIRLAANWPEIYNRLIFLAKNCTDG